MILKNWKELCELQGWKNPNGKNNRKAQETSLNQVCSWYKQGQKVIIDEVFQEVLVRSDNRRDLELMDLKQVIERQIIRTLAKQYNTIHYDVFGNELHRSNNLELNLTLTEWFEELGLVNRNYTNSKRHNHEMYHILDVDVTKKEFNNILNNSHVTLKRWLGDVFNNLSSKRTVVGVEESFKLRLYNNDEDTKKQYPFIYHNATTQQVKFIRSCEGVILDRHSTTLKDVLNGKASIDKDEFYYQVVDHVRKVCRNKDLIKAYDSSIGHLKALRSYYSTVNVSLNPLTINNNLERVKDLLNNDLEVLDVLHHEIEKHDGDIGYIEAIGKTTDNKRNISDTTVDRIESSAIKRLNEASSSGISDTVKKLHSHNVNIITKEQIMDFKGYWGDPNPFSEEYKEEFEFIELSRQAVADSKPVLNDDVLSDIDELFSNLNTTETPKKKPLISDIQTAYVNETTTIIIDDTLDEQKHI